MIARQPEDCDRLIGEAITAGDLDAAVALYEPGATFVPEPGSDGVSGQEAIRKVLAENFIALGGQLEVRVKKVIQAGDLAMTHAEWTLTGGKDASGNPVELAGQSTEVVRRQSDGSWRFVIDHPFRVD